MPESGKIGIFSLIPRAVRKFSHLEGRELIPAPVTDHKSTIFRSEMVF